MIGNFCFTAHPPADCVAVRMEWDVYGARHGTLVISTSLRRAIEAEKLPATDEPLSIDGALAYGVVLAVRAQTTLTLTGDITVWPEEWGLLIRDH